MAPSRGWSSGWTWLAVAVFAAGARWGLMYSSRPFRAVLPASWFEGDAFGLTRLGANAVCSSLLLAVLPIGLLFWARRGAQEGEGWRAGWLGKPERLPNAVAAGLAALSALGGLLAGWSLPGLQAAYPVWRSAERDGHLLLSSLLVVSVILSTEVLYRGVALARMHEAWGARAIYVLVPIYVLDHIGAPTVEVATSALTGILLGHLAARTRSIWPGFAMHAAFAVGVDVGSVGVGL